MIFIARKEQALVPSKALAFRSKSFTSSLSRAPESAAKPWANTSLASSRSLFWWHDNGSTDILFASTFSVPLPLTLVVVEDLPSTLLPFLLVISFSNADISDMFGLSKAFPLQQCVIRCWNEPDCPPAQCSALLTADVILSQRMTQWVLEYRIPRTTNEVLKDKPVHKERVRSCRHQKLVCASHQVLLFLAQ